jgi:hypothetical protein
MALGSTTDVTEMSTRNISWGKGGRCVGMTTLPPSHADYLETSGSLKLLEREGPVLACNEIALTFLLNTPKVFTLIISVPKVLCRWILICRFEVK